MLAYAEFWPDRPPEDYGAGLNRNTHGGDGYSEYVDGYVTEDRGPPVPIDANLLWLLFDPTPESLRSAVIYAQVMSHVG